MSVLRFRVWELGKMIYVPGEGTWGWFGDCVLDNEEPRSMVVMQSTGLKDGKGNEIYESDIVQFHANYTNKPAGYMKAVVVWDYDSWKLAAGEHLYSISEETDEFYYKALVIGNIHESPSLLPL